MLDKEREAEAAREAALSQLLQFIEVSRRDFDEQAQRLMEVVIEARLVKGQHPVALDRDHARVRFPELLQPATDIEVFRRPTAPRYLMSWAVRQVLVGWQFALLHPNYDGADFPECGVLRAAEACLVLPSE